MSVNKYLIKLAAAKSQAQKTELEPGVFWNHSTKTVDIKPALYSDAVNSAASKQGLWGSIDTGLMGGAIGVLLARKALSKVPNKLEKPLLIGGGVLGATLGGLGGHALQKHQLKSDKEWVKDTKARFADKIERKYQDHIDKLEGWE